MAKKTNSPTDADIRRISETLRNTDGGHLIKDRETFDDAWNDYFEGNTEGIGGRSDLRNQTFQMYAENYPDRLVEGVIPELRGKERARVKGIMREISLKEEKPTKEFNIVAREKGRIVYSRKEIIIVRKKEAVRFRDRRGRFTSVRKRK